MLERLIEDWLTKAGERGFEGPFAQLLALEGHRVLQGPVHHAYEHGKDIVTFDSTGRLCAFQLKGGSLDLAALEAVQGQLHALASGAVSYPGVEPARRPDSVFFVVAGRLTAPARDRLNNINLGNQSVGILTVQLVELDALTSRFMEAHGRFLPKSPIELERLLGFYLEDGTGPFPVVKLTAFLDALLSTVDAQSRTDNARAIGSAVLLCGYAVAPWERVDSHLGVAECWLTLAGRILRLAEETSLGEGPWHESYELAMVIARNRLRALLSEAVARQDLVLPDLAEAFVHPARVVLILGYLSALYLSERLTGSASAIEADVRALLDRERPFIQWPGEVAGGYAITIGTALDLIGRHAEGRGVVAGYSMALAKANGRLSETGIPDPYHSFEDTLLLAVDANHPDSEEGFAGNAYTLHCAIDWLARRGERQFLEHLWPRLGKITFCELRLSTAAKILAVDDPDGSLQMWLLPDEPQSWLQLETRSKAVNESEIPGELWRHPEFLPFVPLLIPPRLNGPVTKALDYLVLGLAGVSLDVSVPGEFATVPPLRRGGAESNSTLV